LDAVQKYESDLPSSSKVLCEELFMKKSYGRKKPEKADTPIKAYKSTYVSPNIECLLKILPMFYI